MDSKRITTLLRCWIGAIGVASTLSITACGFGADADTSVRLAREQAAAGKYREALISARKAFDSDPDRLETRLLLGKLYLATGDPASAEIHLRKALQLGGSADEVYPELAKSLYLKGRFNELLSEIGVSKVSSNDSKGRILASRGAAYLQLGNAKSAREEFERLARLAPEDIEIPIGLARAAMLEEDLDTAEAEAGRALEKAPDNAAAVLLQADIEARRGEYARALEHYTTAASLTPDPSNPLWQRATTGVVRVYLANGDADAAIALARKGLKRSGNAPFVRFLLAQSLAADQQFTEANELLRGLLADSVRAPEIYLLLARIDLARNQFGTAESYLTEVLALDRNNGEARKLLAILRLRGNQFSEARSVLVQARDREKNQDSATLELLGLAALGEDRADDAVAYLERALEVDPDNERLKLQLAAAKLKMGDTSSAVSMLEGLPAGQEGNYARERLLISAHLRDGDTAEALAEAKRLATEHPKDSAAHVINGVTLARAGSPEVAEEEFLEALNLAPDNAEIRFQLAALAVAQKQFQKAEKQLLKILATNPDHVRAMLGMAALAETQANETSTVEWLAKAYQASDNDPRIAIALAGRYAKREQPQKALELLAQTDREQKDPSVLLTRAQLRWRLGERERALADLEALSDVAPEWAEGHFLRARAYAELGRPNDADAAIRRVIELDPTHVRATTYLALDAMAKGREEEAHQLAKRLQESEDTRAEGLSLEGRIFAIEKDFTRAANAFDRSLELELTRTAAIGSADTRARAGLPEALDPLRRWVSQNPKDLGARRLLAVRYQHGGREREAAREYRAILTEAPDDVTSLNNLATLLGDLGDEGGATKLARKAHELAPENPAIADTLGWILVRSDSVEEGMALLQQAGQALPDVPEIKYHLAYGLAESGNRKRARQLLETILQLDADFPSRIDAERLLADMRRAEN
jgi:putative PEP-CTERM system TPR-repeat lipoprotein